MLYNQHLEPISTEVTVGTPHLSTPPCTPHDLQSSFPHPFFPRPWLYKVAANPPLFIVRFPIGLDFPLITLPFQGC